MTCRTAAYISRGAQALCLRKRVNTPWGGGISIATYHQLIRNIHLNNPIRVGNNVSRNQ